MTSKPLIITIDPRQAAGMAPQPATVAVPEIRAEAAGMIELTQDEPSDRRF